MSLHNQVLFEYSFHNLEIRTQYHLVGDDSSKFSYSDYFNVKMIAQINFLCQEILQSSLICKILERLKGVQIKMHNGDPP